MDTEEQNVPEVRGTKESQILIKDEYAKAPREDTATVQHAYKFFNQTLISADENLKGSKSQVNKPLHPEETLEYFIENMKTLDFYLEMEKNYNNTIGDPIKIYNEQNNELDHDIDYGEFSLFLSVFFIISIKNSDMNNNSLRSYLKCLEQLLVSIKNENIIENEIRIVFSRLQALIFSDTGELIDTFYCLLIFEEFLTEHREAITYSECFILIRTMKKMNESLALFDKKIIHRERIDKLSSWVINTARSIQRKFYDQLELLDLFFLSLENRYKTLPNHSAEILAVIESLKFQGNLPYSFLFAQKIDDDIIPLVFKHIKYNHSLESLQEACKIVLEQYEELLNDCFDAYQSTSVNTLPRIEFVLFWSLSNILRLPLEQFLIPLCKSQLRSYKQHMKPIVTSFVRRIAYFPENIQYILIEMLVNVEKDYLSFEFVLTKANPQLYCKLIDSEWAQEFVELATKPPFSIILDYFNTSKANLHETLNQITYKIMIMKLPEKLYGFNLRNLNIVLRKFKDCAEAKAATFIVYMHELAHLLQRLACCNIAECISPKSIQNFNVNEGGYKLEQELFGQRLFLLTEDAANFTMSHNVPESVEEFRQKFAEKNEYGENKKVIYLNRYSSVMILGRCMGGESLRLKNVSQISS